MDRYFKGLQDNEGLLYRSNGFAETTIHKDLETIEMLADNLPDVEYILDSIVNYMFTNHLTVKSFKDDENKLYKYLYEMNYNGTRNIDVLKDVAKGYRKYGYYGLYDCGQGLVGVHPKNIIASRVVYDKKPVLTKTLCYVIKRDESFPTREFTRLKGNNVAYGNNISEEEILDIIANPEKYPELLVTTPENFACVRLDTDRVFGTSPLLKDRKRVQLILNILDRMNYDITRNGIGTIALQAKDSLLDEVQEAEAEGFVPGAGELLDMGRTAKSNRAEQIAKDMETLAQQLSETEYNDAIVYSGKFDNLQQLDRDTKAVDFLDYLSQYVSPIISQMFGVPARLFDLGKTVSNIGTHSIIDNAMKNTIIPMRDDFIGQCNPVLQKATGLNEYIGFSSYEFTKDYNYDNDLKILEAYRQLKEIDNDFAEAYLDKNLIV